MREIKFRGKRIDNGEWAYGYYAVHKMMLTGEMDYFIVVNEQRPKSIDPETVGQYTGLKDKNGKEIYESDVLLSRDARKYEVYWSEDWAMFTVRGDDVGALMRIASDSEVIGNVYESDKTVQTNA